MDDNSATLDDRREAVITLENETRTARRVFGGANPLVVGFDTLRNAQTCSSFPLNTATSYRHTRNEKVAPLRLLFRRVGDPYSR